MMISPGQSFTSGQRERDLEMYRLILRTMTSGVAWQFDFDSSSHAMAMETARRWLEQPMNVPGSAMGADLFMLANHKLGAQLDAQHVASFVIRPVNVVTEQ